MDKESYNQEIARLKLNSPEKGFKIICLCVNCGEKFSANAGGKCALTCQYCRTAEGREKVYRNE